MAKFETTNDSASPKASTLVTSGIAVLCLVIFLGGCGPNAGSDPGATQVSATASTSPTSTAAASVNASAEPAANNSSISLASSPSSINACELIDKSEIAAVQGAQVQSITPNAQTSSGMVASQCYYTVMSGDGSRNLSVHLQVMSADPKDPDAVSKYWKKAFHEKGEEDKGEKKEGPPQAVARLGEEAFWVDSGKTGVLYALKKNSLLRLSVGGSTDPKVRLQKSKTLMAKALGRLA